MDSHYVGHSISSSDLSSSRSLSESFKFDSRNSPNSPFSSQFDTESLSAKSDSQGQHSSADNLCKAIPSSALLNSYSYFQLESSAADCHPDCPSIQSSGSTFHRKTNPNHSIQHALQELEVALMAPDDYEEAALSEPSSQFDSSSSRTHRKKRLKRMENPAVHGAPPNYDLKQLLMECASALAEDKLAEFGELVEHTRSRVSISGDPIQRLGAYIIEGLVARKESSGTNIYHALKCNQPESQDLLSYMHIMNEICPFVKFGSMAANGAIAEACKNEDRIHIIDFQIAQGTQWMTLLQALAARPSGAPHVRITGIGDPVSKYARGDGLAAVGRRFADLSKKFNIPVEFQAVPVFALDIRKEMLGVRPDETLAVNFPLLLHHTPDESVDVSNPRDGLLRMVKSLNPKVVTLVEQESNTNTTSFLQRFKEALDFYSAVFESIDITMGRDRNERINVEQQCLARDIVNIIACEGRERVERHELLGKWRSRFTMAGFQQFPLSSYVNSVIRGLLRCYSEHYTLVETNGSLLLGWKDRSLISASAWC